MIKIGIIGINEGNGHPYSWSSIINGHFDTKEISEAGYPGIVQYLEANRSTLGIDGAEVTHLWTQDERLSAGIARSAMIAEIMSTPEEMIGKVDAVILARDDYENHVNMARPFIDAGVPIFVDKPLAGNRTDLRYFSEQSASGKFIMSCSSMRYSDECKETLEKMKSTGQPLLVTAVGKKDWYKYGVHLLEGVVTLLNDPVATTVQHMGTPDENIVSIVFENGVRATIHIFKDISLTFQASLYGDKGWNFVEFKNFYAMFRANIVEFVASVNEGKPRLPFSSTENIMNILIAAGDSLAQEGKLIHLPSAVQKL